MENIFLRKYYNLINNFRSKILHTWDFTLNDKFHKIEYWDSRISGKKKLELDGKLLTYSKDDNFVKTFKIDDYNLNLTHKKDAKPQLKINSRNFMDLMREEQRGELNKENEEYIKNYEEEKNNNKGDTYRKRALKYNGEDYFEENENEYYNIQEQKILLKQFEQNKKEEEKRSENYNKKNKNILDYKTVNKNRIIINNINNIFDDEFNNIDNINNNNFFQFNNDNQINNNQNNLYNQMNNNFNNDNNNMYSQFENNQNIISNINFDLDDNYSNNNNNFNNNFNNQNNENNQNINNNIFSDDFNFFD